MGHLSGRPTSKGPVENFSGPRQALSRHDQPSAVGTHLKIVVKAIQYLFHVGPADRSLENGLLAAFRAGEINGVAIWCPYEAIHPLIKPEGKVLHFFRSPIIDPQAKEIGFVTIPSL